MDVLEYVRRKHSGQAYKGGVPYWLHLDRVANVLRFLMQQYDESDGDVITAAYLHDVLEDTDSTRESVAEEFGSRVSGIVWELTNEQGDDSVLEYFDKVMSSGEEARLVKLADLWDNMTTACRRINENGVEWTKEWFLPKVDRISAHIVNSDFCRFQRTAERLKGMVVLSKELLLCEISNWS